MRTPRLTYANVIATLALFLALGGVSWAATSLPRNSVGTTQLKAGAVRTADLKAGAVTSAKVKDRSLLAKDFKAGELPKGAKGDAGSPGAQGPPGAKGATGDTGPAAGTEAVYGSLGAVTFAPDTIVAIFAGKKTTKAGRLYVSAMVERDISCPIFRATLTVDDVSVPGSLRRVSTGDNPDVMTLQGVTTAAIAPGTHSVKVIGDCEIADAILGTMQYASYNAIVLGS